MSGIYKTAGQVEFSDLMARMKAKDFSPAKVSRLLGVTKASVSRTLAGKQNPRTITLQAFRQIVQEHCGEHPRDRAFSPAKVADQLKFLEDHAPESFEAARATINALHQSAVSSVRLSGDEEKALGGAADAKRAARELEPKPKADAPTARKRERASGDPPGKP